MCGICGIVDFRATPELFLIESMTERLFHRGPDAGGVCSFRHCLLGHRRLSILDLSESAKQPMLSKNGATALVFNGEIYNFQDIRDTLRGKGIEFRTRSDTEVVLELYLQEKENMLKQLNGMFSIAIWDEAEQSLFLARDRLGKKPFYYWVGDGKICFSSELPSLLQDVSIPRELSSQSISEYLLYDFIPAPHTIFKDVRKLPAGHMAVFDSSGMRIRSYWKPPEPEPESSYGDTRKDLEALLSDSVERRLISDVPLGAFLSGGIDSTLVTALMARGNPEKVKTFSISFPGTTHDESEWSSLAAKSIGTDHKEYAVNYDIEGLFPQIVRHFGEPFGDSSAIPTWHLCAHTRSKVTVALSGDGGDELFAGYDRYLARRFQVTYDMLPLKLRRAIIEPLLNRMPETTDYYGTSTVKKLKLFIRAAARIRDNPLAVIPQTFSLSEVRDLTGLDYHAEADPVIVLSRQWAGLDPVSHMTFTDIQTYLAEDILTKVDRMSMAHALEVRSPLLDFRIAEKACRMPLNYKLNGRISKRILRDVAASCVPKPILTRSKYGFQVPLGLWFKTHLKVWTQERLMNPGHDFFSGDFVERLWKDHLSGRADHAHKIWLIVFFNEWFSQLQ
jgi:asparagine synthase (glutamine-hydrolysing)